MDTRFECPWFKSWAASAVAFFFLAISPFVKLLVQPDRSIVIVILIGWGGGGLEGGDHPPSLCPPLMHTSARVSRLVSPLGQPPNATLPLEEGC